MFDKMGVYFINYVCDTHKNNYTALSILKLFFKTMFSKIENTDVRRPNFANLRL